MYHNESFDWDLPLVDKGLHRDPAMHADVFLAMANSLRAAMAGSDRELFANLYELQEVRRILSADRSRLSVCFDIKRTELRAKPVATLCLVYNRAAWVSRSPDIEPVIARMHVATQYLDEASDTIGAFFKSAAGAFMIDRVSEWAEINR